MKCLKCNQNVPDDSEYCTHCGARIEHVEIGRLDIKKEKTIRKNKPVKKKYCSQCGTQINSTVLKCPSCGKAFFPVKPIIISITSIAVLIAVVCLSLFVIVPEIKYQKAISLMNQGDYINANKIFNELQDYRNSTKLIHTHNYSELVEQVDGTCESDGYCIKKCSCGETNKTVIRGGHSYTSATCLEPSKCTKCGATGSPALGHDTDHAFCSRCGKILFETKKYTGYEAGNITGIFLPEGKYNVTCNYSGSSYGGGNFIVHGLDNKIYVNEIGRTSYVCQINVFRTIKNGVINISDAKEGNWSIIIEAYE